VTTRLVRCRPAPLVRLAAAGFAVVCAVGESSAAGSWTTSRVSTCATGKAIARSSTPSGGRALRGDVDGRGASDLVYLASVKGVPLACRWYIVVDADSRRQAVPIRRIDRYQSRPPQLNVLARIDGAPGSEIVVTVNSGASIAFAAVFTIADARLTRMTVQPSRFVADDTFGYGAGGAIALGATCTQGRRDVDVVASEAERSVGGWRVERRFYRAAGSRFVRTPRRQLVRTRSLSAFPEFATWRRGRFVEGPFASCAPRPDA
jgi:hypothetical protein